MCRQSSDADSFSIKLTLDLGEECTAQYSLVIGSDPGRSFEIRSETCKITEAADTPSVIKGYERFRSTPVMFSLSLGIPEIQELHSSRPSLDRLYLGNLAGWPVFDALHQVLANMAFYNPATAPMRDYQSPDPGDQLTPNGSNLASVFRTLRLNHPESADRVGEFLSAVVPRLRNVVDADVGEKVTLQFTETEPSGTGKEKRTFYASSMSDGTLRVVAILLALFQQSERVSLVGIEEPEMGIHPGAVEVLFDSFQEGARLRQLLVTTHSSELLDRDDIDHDSILAFSTEEGQTLVEPFDDTVRGILRKTLSTPSEMLRKDLLGPNDP